MDSWWWLVTVCTSSLIFLALKINFSPLGTSRSQVCPLPHYLKCSRGTSHWGGGNGAAIRTWKVAAPRVLTQRDSTRRSPHPLRWNQDTYVQWIPTFDSSEYNTQGPGGVSPPPRGTTLCVQDECVVPNAQDK